MDHSISYTRVGDTWHFSDGTTLPVVAGGSDVGTIDTGAGGDLGAPPAAPPAGAPPTEPAAPTGPPRDPTGRFAPSTAPANPPAGQPPTSDHPPGGPGGMSAPSFDEINYDDVLQRVQSGEPVTVEQLQHYAEEHKKYRQKWSPVAQTFDGYSPEDVEDLQGFLRDLKDPAKRGEAAQWMRGVLDHLSPAQQAAVAQQQGQPTPGAEEEWDPFDPAKVEARLQKMLDSRMQQEQQQREVAAASEQIMAKARELGYKADPTDPDYQWLLLTAKQKFPSVAPIEALVKAHEHIEAQLNERAKRLLQARAQDASQPTAPQEGMAPSGRRAPRTMAEADKSAAARIDAIFRGSPGT